MLLISDANIFIDLDKTDLLKHFDGLLDEMVLQGCVSASTMIEKLTLLKEINKRLPIKEIDDRIERLTP